MNAGVRLECVVEYNPKSPNLTIQWKKEGKVINIPGCFPARDRDVCDDGKYRIRISSLTSSSVRALLKIKHFDKQVDTVVYTCEASNAYGTTEVDMKVGN